MTTAHEQHTFLTCSTEVSWGGTHTKQRVDIYPVRKTDLNWHRISHFFQVPGWKKKKKVKHAQVTAIFL